MKETPIVINTPNVIVSGKKKITDYDGYSTSARHLQRESWNKAFNFKWPEDIYLGISSDIDKNEMPSQFQEIYQRFWNLGFINDYGNQCILMSSVLRRILRLHGFNASQKQMICYYEKENKGQKITIGTHMPIDPTDDQTIDTHVAVSVSGYILDFALSPINYMFGATAPKALIGLDVTSNEYQDFGISGAAAWSDVKPSHPIIKHWRLSNKNLEMELTKKYFEKYQF